MNKPIIVGCGDVGRRVLQRLNQRGLSAICVTRNDETIATLSALQCEPVQWDLDQPQLLDQARFEASEVFYFAPPPSTGEQDTRLRGVLKALGAAPKRIVLISTTGVYGDCAGDWVDENSPLQPVAARAFRRVDAEAALQTWASEHQRDAVILRVPGIYAQDRLPLARLKRGEPVINAAEAAYTNRIHADDLAMICDVAMRSAAAGSVFNACDGHPTTMTEYFNHVADFAGLVRPPQLTLVDAEQQVSAGMLSYLRESRRICNQKLLNELGVTLCYPDLQAALPLHVSRA